MQHLSFSQDLLPYFYDAEKDVARIFADFHYTFSPALISGNVADPGLYNLPATTPDIVESVTHKAAGVPVSDAYTGTTPWNLLAHAGGVTTSSAKNDILSKYVIATGSDGFKAVFLLRKSIGLSATSLCLLRMPIPRASLVFRAARDWRGSSRRVISRAAVASATWSAFRWRACPSQDRPELAAFPCRH